MKTEALSALARTETGRRACHKLRRAGFLPANLYASSQVDGKTVLRNETLKVSAYDIDQLLKKHAKVLEVTYEGGHDLCQLTEVQRDAMGSSLLHVDLRVIDPNKPMHAPVELVFKGEPKGVKLGGLLRVLIHQLELEALPRDMPHEILIHVDHLDIHDVLHVSELNLAEGVKALTNPTQLVVQVVPPVEETDEPDDDADMGAEGASAEPEVISKGKKEEE
jgi:large subunit ribosomal protein L25